jgi:hypothetical protein
MTYNFGKKVVYSDEKLKGKKFDIDKLKHPSYDTENIGATGRYAGWNTDDEKALISKLEHRAKYSFNPDLMTDRSAVMWLLNQGKNPDDYTYTPKNLDNDPETPDDLIIKTKDGRLFSAGGYRMRPYTAVDMKKERRRYDFLTANPDSKVRKEEKTLWSNYNKDLNKDESAKAPSTKVNKKMDDLFKEYLTTIEGGKLKIKCGIKGKTLTAPGYFALLQAMHRTFKNCIALPYVMFALSGGTPNAGILPKADAVKNFLTDQIFTMPLITKAIYEALFVDSADAAKAVLDPWSDAQWKAFKKHRRYTIWSPILNGLNTDTARFYNSVLTSNPDAILTKFINAFAPFVIKNWAGPGDMKLRVTPVDPEPFSPSPLIPIDIYQGISRKQQREGFAKEILQLNRSEAVTKQVNQSANIRELRAKLQADLDTLDGITRQKSRYESTPMVASLIPSLSQEPKEIVDENEEDDEEPASSGTVDDEKKIHIK